RHQCRDQQRALGDEGWHSHGGQNQGREIKAGRSIVNVNRAQVSYFDLPLLFLDDPLEAFLLEEAFLPALLLAADFFDEAAAFLAAVRLDADDFVAAFFVETVIGISRAVVFVLAFFAGLIKPAASGLTVSTKSAATSRLVSAI